MSSDNNQPVEANVELGQFSNENLLKIESHDSYSMAGAIKKKISAAFPRPTPDAPLLPGLIRVGKAPKSSYVYFSFESEGDREAAAEKLVTLAHRNKKWERKPVTKHDLTVTHSGATVKRKRDDNEGNKGAKAEKKEAPNVAPWWGIPYEEQIKRKTEHCEKIMTQICRNQQTHRRDMSFLRGFDGVYESETKMQYRNHVNLTCGYDARGAPCIGFNEGAMIDGYTSVLPVTDPSFLATTHTVAIHFAKVIQNLAVFRFPLLTMLDKRKNGAGFWRRLQIRHNVDAEVMIDIEVDTHNVSAAVMDDVAKALISTLCSDEASRVASEAVNDGRQWKVVSLQYHGGHGSSQIPEKERVTLFGASTLRETVRGLKFDLSPTAFFQVNTKGMEKMMDLVGTCANLNKNTILLDLCCGTGTIGLCFANQVKRIIGIEMVADAIENAKVNAELNGVSNTEYYAMKLEDCLQDVLRRLKENHNEERDGPLHIVGILDPPRCGVHPSVVKTLRNLPTIEELVYISCDQKALVNDGEGFTKESSKQFWGEKFRIVRGFGLDLFPHSHHVEMVAVLKRGEALKTHEAHVAATATSDNPVAASEN